MRRGGPHRRFPGRPAASLVLVAVLATAGSSCRGILSAPGGPSADAGHGVVERVIDGDTVDVRLGGRTERVRLIGVDTPETVAPTRPVQCYGAEASAETKSLLPEGTPVRLERDEVSRDKYGRLLAYVFREADDLLVNLTLVEGGFGNAVNFGDNEALYPVLSSAEARARASGAGLWSACGGPDVAIGPPPGR